jgi:hypothetical protein
MCSLLEQTKVKPDIPGELRNVTRLCEARSGKARRRD